MTIWMWIRCDSVISELKLGMKIIMKMKPIFDPLEQDRRTNMIERTYIYLMIIGVASEFQKRGYGTKLMEALIQESEDSKKPLYLETASERNIVMYEKLGFKLLNKMIHPIINLPQWELMRELKTT